MTTSFSKAVIIIVSGVKWGDRVAEEGSRCKQPIPTHQVSPCTASPSLGPLGYYAHLTPLLVTPLHQAKKTTKTLKLRLGLKWKEEERPGIGRKKAEERTARKEGLAPSTASVTQHAHSKYMLKDGLGTKKEAGPIYWASIATCWTEPSIALGGRKRWRLGTNEASHP